MDGVLIDMCRFPRSPGNDSIRGFGANEASIVDCYYAATNATGVNAVTRTNG